MMKDLDTGGAVTAFLLSGALGYTLQTWPTPPLPLWGVKPTREPFPNSDDSNEHTR
jgi:hypothetical protein